MKRASLLAAVLALTGCGDLLGIEVLSFDGGEESGPGSDAGDGSVPDAPKSDGFAADAPQTGDGPESSDGPSPTDSKSNDSPSSDGPGNDGPGNDGGCAAGTSGCTGNTPWSCVNGKVVDGAACSNQACVSGGCVGVCAPGQTQCTAGDGAFQTCQSDGTWSTTTTCSGPIGGSPTCDPTAGCGAGTCSSSSLPDLCGNSCVNVTNDGYNCGLCGQTCTGSTCSGGYCTVQSMCDGSSIGGNAVNTGNASRLARETLAGVGGPYPNAYFGVGGSVYDCQVPSAAPSPPPVPTVTLAQTGGVCSQYFNDVVNDKSQAYVFDSHGGDCHGASLELVPSGTDVSGALFGTLESDVANTSALYALVSPALNLVTFTTSAGTTTTSSTTCITVSGTLGDGAAGGGFVAAVDTAQDVIRGATVSGGTCSASVGLASGVTSETAIAVAPTGTVFAFENGTTSTSVPPRGAPRRSSRRRTRRTWARSTGTASSSTGPLLRTSTGSARPASRAARRSPREDRARPRCWFPGYPRRAGLPSTRPTSTTCRGWSSIASPSEATRVAQPPGAPSMALR